MGSTGEWYTQAVKLFARQTGKAINISKTTMPHALSYFLTKTYGLPHGYAVALTLGAFIKFNGEVDQASYIGHISYKDLNRIS